MLFRAYSLDRLSTSKLAPAGGAQLICLRFQLSSVVRSNSVIGMFLSWRRKVQPNNKPSGCSIRIEIPLSYIVLIIDGDKNSVM